jgi:excisionase family DNA binding protein
MGQKKVTIAQVAEQYELSTRTVRRYIAEGRLTAYRIGPRVIRLDAEQVRLQLDGDPVSTPDDAA